MEQQTLDATSQRRRDTRPINKRTLNGPVTEADGCTARYHVATRRRQRPANVKDAVVKRRQFDTLRLQSEEVAEFNYRPTACGATYRMVVVRKNITKEKGEQRLYDEIRYFIFDI